MSQWTFTQFDGQTQDAFEDAFTNSGLSPENYSALLLNLASQNDLPDNITLSVGALPQSGRSSAQQSHYRQRLDNYRRRSHCGLWQRRRRRWRAMR